MSKRPHVPHAIMTSLVQEQGSCMSQPQENTFVENQLGSILKDSEDGAAD